MCVSRFSKGVQQYFWLVGCVVAFLLIGCGSSAGSSVAVAPVGGSTTPAPTRLSTSVPTTSATPSPTKMPVVGAAPTPTKMPAVQPTPALTKMAVSGGVTLKVEAATAALGSTMVVTIQNQSGQAIVFADHKTNCTVLVLEMQVAGGWVAVATCKLMIKTSEHFLQAGGIAAVQLVSSTQWSAGIYRARLDYGSEMGGGANTIYSSEFRLV